jgi:flagellar hook assembly protein FlgD
LIQYKLDSPGYLATLQIFDSDGFYIRDLTNNELLATEGSLKWDGDDGDGNRLRTGIYILVSRLLNPTSGKILQYKNAVVVSERL